MGRGGLLEPAGPASDGQPPSSWRARSRGLRAGREAWVNVGDSYTCCWTSSKWFHPSALSQKVDHCPIK